MQEAVRQLSSSRVEEHRQTRSTPDESDVHGARPPLGSKSVFSPSIVSAKRRDHKPRPKMLLRLRRLRSPNPVTNSSSKGLGHSVSDLHGMGVTLGVEDRVVFFQPELPFKLVVSDGGVLHVVLFIDLKVFLLAPAFK